MSPKRKLAISNASFGWLKVCAHWAKWGRAATGVAPGFQLSPRIASVRKKLAAHSDAATQPGPDTPNNLMLTPPRRRTKNKSQTERHANKAHPLRALLRRADVRDISLCHCDVGAAHACNQRGNLQDQQACCPLLFRSQREDRVRHCCNRGAHQQNRPAPDTIRKPPPNRGKHELHRGVCRHNERQW